MKKRLLLLTAVLSASVNVMFAQSETSATVTDKYGNTYSYDTVEDLDANSEKGDTLYSNGRSFDINTDQYKVTLKSDLRITVSDCNLIYNVKLTNASATSSNIAPFTERVKSSTTIYDVVVKEEDIVYTKMSGNYVSAYTPNKTSEEFAKYIVACTEIKNIQPAIIFTGRELRSAKWNNTVIDEDDDGVEIVDELYYMNFRRNKFLPILNIDGDYARGTIYSNCYVTYNPTAIAEGYESYTVTGDGKVGYVYGVVDDGKVEAILNEPAYTYLNYDFSNASILGAVSTDINDNRIAYFATGAEATGQNIVVGNSCDSYVISDNGQEIYVNKDFAANKSKYKRTFSPDTYGTIVLPFPVQSTSNIFVKHAKLTDYDASINKLTFTTAESVAPYTPYMFKVLSTANAQEPYTFYGPINGTVEATKTATSAKFNGAQLVGTLEGLSAEDASQVYVIGSMGKVGRTTKALKPGRCYLTREINSNAKVENAAIEIIDEDGSIETVEVDETVTAIDGVVNGEVVSVQYISVNGQVSNEPFSGINLVKKTFADGSVETSKVAF
jgi:hypothetical protein